MQHKKLLSVCGNAPNYKLLLHSKPPFLDGDVTLKLFNLAVLDLFITWLHYTTFKGSINVL